MMGFPDRSNTTAVVSTFNPPASTVANCGALLQQCAEVVVVDDGSSSDDQTIYDSLEALGCVVLRLPKNVGIAAALNSGVDTARKRRPGLEYILTMDQDSLVPAGYVALLEKAAAEARAVVAVGMVAPGKVSGLPRRTRRNRNGVITGDEPVQSGLLIPVSTFEAVGGFDERLFIDGVDSDFYLRAKRKNLRCVIAPTAELKHSLGTMVPARVGPWRLSLNGKPILVRTAASWRYYFIMRNRILLARKYAFVEPFWTLRGVLLDVRHVLFVNALAPGRKERLAATIHGVQDGLRGRTGPRPTP
jgi:rhamnosyltransferase